MASTDLSDEGLRAAARDAADEVHQPINTMGGTRDTADVIFEALVRIRDAVAPPAPPQGELEFWKRHEELCALFRKVGTEHYLELLQAWWKVCSAMHAYVEKLSAEAEKHRGA